MYIGQIGEQLLVSSYGDPAARAMIQRARRARGKTYSAVFGAIWQGLSWPVRRLVAGVAAARRARRNARALQQLSDRMLQDIGIARGEIEEIARARAARPAEQDLTIAELRGRSTGAETGGAGRGARTGAARPDHRRGRTAAGPLRTFPGGAGRGRDAA